MALESFRGCLFHSHCEYNEILLICGNMKLQSLLDMLKTPDSFRLKKLSTKIYGTLVLMGMPS